MILNVIMFKCFAFMGSFLKKALAIIADFELIISSGCMYVVCVILKLHCIIQIRAH